MMVTWDDSNGNKSSSLDDEQANIYLMVDTNEKIEVKTCSESDTSSSTSLDDEEDMPYDLTLALLHMWFVLVAIPRRLYGHVYLDV
ncbi:hypothetical protein JHK87_053024 [Glycine soja]|nr:hypothetical protein JHK87_053024 [Glycine soja]